MARFLRRWGTGERGAAIVEFAILLPLFLLILGGIFDAGRAFFRQVELTNAAREGARLTVVDSSATAGDVEARAQASAPGLTMTTSVSLCGGPGTDAQVTTSSNFTWFILGPAMSLFGVTLANNPLTSTAVMRCD